MRISLVVAASANNVIGVAGGLPWHLATDLRRFKAITMGKPMVMGRATWESIGRALPGRRSIVVTRQGDFSAAGGEIVTSIDAALAATADADELMVIGGGQIYRQFLPMAQRIYLTTVHAEIAGDTTFPALDEADWQLVESESIPASASQPYALTFKVLDRKT